jgi:hypothetical protein
MPTTQLFHKELNTWVFKISRCEDGGFLERDKYVSYSPRSYKNVDEMKPAKQRWGLLEIGWEV